MTEQDLIKQLAKLPNEVEAPEQWASIEAAIKQQDSMGQELATEVVVKPKSWWPKALIASAASVALLLFSGLMIMPQQSAQANLNLVQVKTIQSLQQANGQYYQLLGNKMKITQGALNPSMSSTLGNLRDAQQQYLTALEQNPDDTRLFRQLLKSYQTERKLLKQLLS